MSVSTDGIFFWGLDLGDFEIDRERLEESDVSDALEEYGVVLWAHCSDAYPMYYLAVEDVVEIAPRGYPKVIGSEVLARLLDPKERARWEAQLRAAFAYLAGDVGLEIEWTEPRAMLASYWG